MDNLLKYFEDFVLLFVLINLVYYLYYSKKKSDYSKLKKNDEIKLFIARYNLDMRKTNYKTVLRIIGFCNSFIISFAAILVLNIKNYFWKIGVAFIVIFVLIYALFEIFGRLLKKREMKKNV